MNKKLQKIADERDVCCVYRMFATTMHWQSKNLARELSVTPRCIRQNRHNLRTGELKCKNYRDCQGSITSILSLNARFQP